MSETTERLQTRTHLATLSTEQADPRYAGIELLSTLDLARTMNEADASVPAAVAACARSWPRPSRPSPTGSKGGRLLYVGAGTAGRMGVLDAAECLPTFNTDPSGEGELGGRPRPPSGGAVEGTDDVAASRSRGDAAEGIGPSRRGGGTGGERPDAVHDRRRSVGPAAWGGHRGTVVQPRMRPFGAATTRLRSRSARR